MIIFIIHYIFWIIAFNLLWHFTPDEKRVEVSQGMDIETIPNWALIPLLLASLVTSIIHFLINEVIL